MLVCDGHVSSHLDHLEADRIVPVAASDAIVDGLDDDIDELLLLVHPLSAPQISKCDEFLQDEHQVEILI